MCMHLKRADGSMVMPAYDSAECMMRINDANQGCSTRMEKAAGKGLGMCLMGVIEIE